MNKLDFFTPVTYEFLNPKSFSILQKVDNYFHLGDKKAFVIKGKTKSGLEKVILHDSKCSVREKAIKICSYFTIVIPLFMFISKVILRITYSFKVIDPKKSLEKGINVNQSIIDKIQELFPYIKYRFNSEELEWVSKTNNSVFKLRQVPNLIFKMANARFFQESIKNSEQTEIRFANMIKAKKICEIYALHHLVIPHAKKFTVKTDEGEYCIIAEEVLDIVEGNQNFLFDHLSNNELDESFRQLAIFIAKTGFSDVSRGNIPILKKRPLELTRRIGLIDLEHMNDVEIGFVGKIYTIPNFRTWGSMGLIRCVSTKKQIEIVLNEANKQKVSLSKDKVENTKNLILKELKYNNNFRRHLKRENLWDKWLKNNNLQHCDF